MVLPVPMTDIDTRSVPPEFTSEDCLFHYTTHQTAIQHILFQQQIRLSPRTGGIDPVENMIPPISLSNCPDGGEESSHKEQMAVYEEVKKQLKHAKQICFCRNDMENVQLFGIRNWEYYGFLKPRMWDQYGDHYGGVCLCFSRSAINMRITDRADIFHGDVTYRPYGELFAVSSPDIDCNCLGLLGPQGYLEKHREHMKRYFLRKHIDYSTEMEYRYVSLSPRDFDYMDISDCIRGLVVSLRGLSEFERHEYQRYSQERSYNVMYIDWAHDGFGICPEER
jgi:hypothetical protein